MSVVVVSYRTADLLPACLNSIQAAADGLSYEVWVVDNASGDGTVEMLRRDYPWVRLIANTRNVGYAAANNQALERASGDTFLLLNPDTVMAPGCLRRLHQAMRDNPRIGAVGPRLLNVDGTLQRSAHHFHTPAVLLLEQVNAGAVLRHLPGVGRIYLGAWPHDEPRRVDWMVGACLLLRRESLDTVGVLDADFFLYAEEIDLMWRLARRGWESWIIPDATVVHHGGASTSQIPVWSGMQSTRAMYQFYRKHYTARRLAAAQLVLRGVALLKIVRDGVRLGTRALTGQPTAPVHQALTLWSQVLRLRPPSPSGGARGGLIRRLDWRYLLPAGPGSRYDRLLLASGSANDDRAKLLAVVKEAGLAESTGSWYADGSADCVAVLSGAAVTLPDAARRVGTGGVLYYEVDRLKCPHLTPGRARRQLLEAGLRVHSLYWAKPGFEHCELWIPLQGPGALKYYLDNLFMAVSPVRQLVRMLMRRGTAVGVACVPRFAVLARRGEVQDDRLSRLLSGGRLGGEPGAPTEPLLVTVGPDERSRVVGLAFTGTDDQPRAVVKATRLAQFNERTIRESELLGELRTGLPAELAPSLPTPLRTGLLDDAAVLVETPALGRCLAASCADWGVPLARKIDDLRAATGWLAAFHQATQLSTSVWEAAAEGWLETSISRYTRRFGSTPAESQLWNALRRRSELCQGLVLPCVWQHRDFHAWNVFRGPNGLTVIDWEAAQPGLPLADLSYFGVWWYQTVHRLHGERAKISGFLRLIATDRASDRAARAVHGEWNRYLAALDIDARLAPLLHTLAWMGHALDEAERREASGTPDGDPRLGNIFCRYVEAFATRARR